MTDLVSSDEAGCRVANEALALALDAMEIDADPCELHRCFGEAPVGAGDVWMFTSRQDPQNVFIIDLYRGLTDQLDLVVFSARCAEGRAPLVKQHFRRFFDDAAYQVGYEEANVNASFRLHADRRRYPHVVPESGYAQQFIER